jgi:hypothetical protein
MGTAPEADPTVPLYSIAESLKLKVMALQLHKLGFCISWLAWYVAVSPVVSCRQAIGQELPNSPNASTAEQPAEPLALLGEPFGVVRVELPLPPNGMGESPRVLVAEANGRLFYPVVTVRSVEVQQELPQAAVGRRGGLIDRLRTAIRGEVIKRQVPVAITVSGLFRGAEPLELELHGDIEQRLYVKTASSVVGISHEQLLTQWWQAYGQSARQGVADDGFPKLVHKYLVSMLSSRLGLPQVDIDSKEDEEKGDPELTQPLKTLSLLAAIEPLREEILEDVLSSPEASTETHRMLPAEPQWEPTVLPPLPAEVAIEELATRVPPECFYIRFGAFANYVWFQEIAERFGGDFAQAVLLRGFNYDASARMERMLASKLTAIAKMFGDKLIGDMAVIGSDLYMKEGATLGVLFLATNPDLLAAAMESERKGVLAKHSDATLSDVQIAGRAVSLLSTPDNRIRSFMVRDGRYFFVSTSQTLVQRFLEVGGGAPALSDSPNFRWARTWMPDANDYAVFAYFSPEFFHRLVGHHYQIELRRRLAAIAHIEIAEMATQVAQGEGLATTDLESLNAAGLLPAWFDQRVDGARTLRTDNGWIDSLRGARGSFLPIADVPVETVSQREVDQYASIAKYYQEEWRSMDPMLLGLRRFRADGSKTEQVAIEAYIAPFDAEKYGWIARQLGAPTPIELLLPADDAATVQMHIRGKPTLGISSEDYHLFGGVKDMIPPDAEDTNGLLKTIRALKMAPAYIGGWPKPGILEQLPLGIGLARPDAAGFSRMIGGLWRWQDSQFSLLSFDRSILEQAIGQLGVKETQDLAQVRARVAPLAGTQLASWINRQWYQRGWEASHGNTELLDTIEQQLRVPAGESLAVAERLLDVRLQCPLGGTYQFTPLSPDRSGVATDQSKKSGDGWWRSTAWPLASFDSRGKPLPPPEYAAPWVDWFRGGRVHVTQGENSLALVGSIELEMQPLAVELNPQLPSLLPTLNFDLFSLPQQLFGGNPDNKQPATRSF